MPWRTIWVLAFALMGCGAEAPTPAEQGVEASATDRARALWPMPNPALSDLPNPRSYGECASATGVLDAVTGLCWQKSADRGPGDGGGFIFEDAPSHCEGLELGGHVDWRLPTRIELVSIVDFSVAGPALDRAFTDASSDAFWSASPVPGDSEQRFHLNFFFGYTTANLTVYAQGVRCVRTELAPERAALGPLVPEADTVRDPATGLTWQRSFSPEPVTFLDALAYCEGLELDGFADYRLPTMKELQTLVREDEAAPPLVDHEAFPDGPAELSWTSSVLSGDPTNAWLVRFSDGYSLYATTDTLARSLCVR